MHSLLHNTGFYPCEELSSHSLTLYLTGYIPEVEAAEAAAALPSRHTDNMAAAAEETHGSATSRGDQSLLFKLIQHLCFLLLFKLIRVFRYIFKSDQIRSVAQSCPTLCDPMNSSTPGLPVHHQLPEFTQTHVHRVSDAIQPSHPLSSPSPPAPNPSQHQGLLQ